MRVITLGTAGGPRWWTGAEKGRRAGIATAVEVDGGFYLIDCGLGVGRQLMMAGLDLRDLHGVFLTHLHSDHVVDLPSIVLFGSVALPGLGRRIPVVGPGERGTLPPVSERAKSAPEPVAPKCPTPGTRIMFERIVEAFATDINDRVLNALRPAPSALFEPREIEIPDGIGYHPNENPFPDMEPFTIFSDDRVQISAILVAHAPMTPAFAFRIDSDHGSVTISGDTGPCENVVRLAHGTDLLLHEAIDFDWVASEYAHLDAEFAAASTDHHHRSHTSAQQAVQIARRAGANALALHHLVPGTKPTSEWMAQAGVTADWFFVPEDLDVIDIAELRR